MILAGTTIAPGIAHGSATLWAPARVPVQRREVSAASIPLEIARWEHALQRSRKEIEALAARVEITVGTSAARIFRAHELVLEDAAFVAAIRRYINEECLAAESAVAATVDEFVQQFGKMSDRYLAGRAADVTEIGRRLQTHLGKEGPREITRLRSPGILVAENLSAADVIALDRTHLLGLVMLQTGANSHAALLASTLGIPVVGSVPQLVGHLHDGDTLIVDGNHGHVIVRPTDLAIREYVTRREIFQQFRGELANLRNAPAVTLDGRTVQLYSNIGLVEEIPEALAEGAEGIGLVRTEYFYLAHPEPPSEEDQYRFYTTVIKAAREHPVTFRTFDLGGDKLSTISRNPETNPMLGCRGIRLFMEHRELMADQLRALLRASRHGPIRILFPLVTGLTEFQDTMQLVDHWKRELRSQGTVFDESVPFGCMIETPAAATISDHLASEAEFFSIGSNDLIQYSLATDRTNPRVAYLYEPLHLAVLRMMRTSIRAAHQKNRPVSICGEMASDPIYTIILLGMGIDELSVNPSMLPAIKKIIRGVTWKEAREAAKGVLRERRAKDVQTFLEGIMVRRFPQVMSVFRDSR